MDSETIELVTDSRLVSDITTTVRGFCSGRRDGLCSIFLPHSTAGVALIETGSSSEADLCSAIERLFPRDAAYVHRHGSPGHGADHVLPAFCSPSLVLPVHAGEPMLGVWQSVVVVDTNIDNPTRRVVLSFLPG